MPITSCKSQQQTRSTRIPDSLREFLELSWEFITDGNREAVSISDVARLLLESARQDRLDFRFEAAELQQSPTSALLKIRQKWEQQNLTRAEWVRGTSWHYSVMSTDRRSSLGFPARRIAVRWRSLPTCAADANAARRGIQRNGRGDRQEHHPEDFRTAVCGEKKSLYWKSPGDLDGVLRDHPTRVKGLPWLNRARLSRKSSTISTRLRQCFDVSE